MSTFSNRNAGVSRRRQVNPSRWVKLGLAWASVGLMASCGGGSSDNPAASAPTPAPAPAPMITAVGVPFGVSATATVDAAAAGTIVTNVATLTAVDQADTDPADDSDSAAIAVQAVDLAVAKTVSDPSPDEGDFITWTITVTNAGSDPATGVQWGNFPQTYSMVGLVNSATRLSIGWDEAF